MTRARVSVRVEPTGAEWAGLVAARWREAGERSRRLRAELGLPTDRPIVMAGHHAAFWHCGILAKVFAAERASSAAGGAAAWVVVDQDEAEFATVRAPMRDGKGLLRVQELRLCEPPAAGVAAAGVPAFEPRTLRPTGGPFALPSVSWGAAGIVESLLSRRGEANAARQATHATFDLLAAHARTPAIVYATSMARTALFQELAERMLREPARAVESYNAAVERFPDAGVAPLVADVKRGRWELPLWRLSAASPRERVFSDEMRADAFEGLAPRALLMTGILRLAACDCFVHGIGGIRYDRATEAWFKDWLGESIAPMVLTTADVFLPFEEASISAAEVAAAAWRVHRARHDPAIVGRDDLVPRKHAMVAAVRSAKERGAAAQPLYREMHEMLALYRDQERGRLRDLADKADRLREKYATRRIVEDRTWAFPFYDAGTLEALKGRVGEAFGARG